MLNVPKVYNIDLKKAIQSRPGIFVNFEQITQIGVTGALG